MIVYIIIHDSYREIYTACLAAAANLQCFKVSAGAAGIGSSVSWNFMNQRMWNCVVRLSESSLIELFQGLQAVLIRGNQTQCILQKRAESQKGGNTAFHIRNLNDGRCSNLFLQYHVTILYVDIIYSISPKQNARLY